MSITWPWLLACIIAGLAGVWAAHAVGSVPHSGVLPMADSVAPTAYAQAINVVQIHPNREIVQQSVRTMEDIRSQRLEVSRANQP